MYINNDDTIHAKLSGVKWHGTQFKQVRIQNFKHMIFGQSEKWYYGV